LIDIAELKNIPIERNCIFEEKYPDYPERKTFYKKTIVSQIPVDTSHLLFLEKLVDVKKNGLMGKNYYFDSPILKSVFEEAKQYVQGIWLRKSVVEDLKTIDEALRSHGLRLFVLSGYRHPKLQRLIVEQMRKEKGDKFVENFFANPDIYAPHASGGVFDIEIWNTNNNCMLLTKILNVSGRYVLEELELIRDNRRLLHNLLTTNCVLESDKVFIPHPDEYWHYGRCERFSAFLSALENYVVCYDTISL